MAATARPAAPAGTQNGAHHEVCPVADSARDDFPKTAGAVLSSNAPEQTVLAAMQGWNAESVPAGQIETTLSYFADDATFRMISFPPQIPAEFKGKEAIRAAYESWLPLHPRLEVKVDRAFGDTVWATTSYWSDGVTAMGIAPLVGSDVYVVREGKIVKEMWTLDEASREAFAAAFAAAMAPTPEPALAAEAPIASLADLVGTWQIWIGGDPSEWRVSPDGRFVVNENSSRGTLAVEGSRLHFLTETYCPTAQEALYDVFVTRQGDTPVKLRLVLVGEDGCAPRREALAGKTLVPAKP